MKENKFIKEYMAIVEGHFENNKGTVDAPIARKEKSIIERCVDKNGDKSITHYDVLKQLEINNTKISIVKCTLQTGRTHQIRVHMSYIGHPLLGDDLYGGNKILFNRQALHSSKISFIHPLKNVKVEYISNLPEDFKNLYNIK